MSLDFPFQNPPVNNQVVDINPHVKWIRQALPMSLNHINCYLLRDGPGWCVVDTGMNLEGARKNWLDILEGTLNGATVTRVIATHHHPDHIGLAGWLSDNFLAPLFTTELEYFYCRTFRAPREEGQIHWSMQELLSRMCIKQESLKHLSKGGNGYGRVVSRLPSTYHQVKEGEMLTIGEHQWMAITTRGHAPEHLSLYCSELDIYISGDQVLPKITSNVSVPSFSPDSNPLQDWYDSHDKVAEQVADSVLVLPSHELPFKGLHERLKQVIEHHDERLNIMLEACKEPNHAQALTDIMFDRELDAFANYMAVGECLAHLHLLMARGLIEKYLEDGKYLFKTI